MSVRLLATLALTTFALLCSVAPAAAKDEVTGPPDVTILIGAASTMPR